MHRSPRHIRLAVLDIVKPPNGLPTNRYERLGKSKLAAAMIASIVYEYHLTTKAEVATLIGYKHHASVCELSVRLRSGDLEAAAAACGWPSTRALKQHIVSTLGFPLHQQEHAA